MKEFSLKEALKNKDLTIGSWLTLADTDVCEMMTKADFDWLVVDMEHSSIGLREMSRLVQVMDLAGVTALVRVASNDPTLIKHALESGAKGIIVPMVSSVDDAKAAVSAAYYPPHGTRGVGLYRAQGYGRDFENYRDVVSREIVVIVQIEHKDAVENLEAIMAVDGVDAFMVGPYDLSGSYGKPGDFENEEVAASLASVENFCRINEKAGGLHIVHDAANQLEKRIAEGYKFIAYGTDMIFLAEKISAEQAALKKIKNTTSGGNN